METCGTCKFRGEEIKKWDSELFEDRGTGYFLCDQIKHDKAKEYQHGQHALVADGSGYYAALCVETDFGCIKHSK